MEPKAASKMLAKVRKTYFLRHLYIKTIILPRQARDKHRKNSKKGRFSQGIQWRLLRGIEGPEGRQLIDVTDKVRLIHYDENTTGFVLFVHYFNI
jgi:hypothetical protein